MTHARIVVPGPYPPTTTVPPGTPVTYRDATVGTVTNATVDTNGALLIDVDLQTLTLGASLIGLTITTPP